MKMVFKFCLIFASCFILNSYAMDVHTGDHLRDELYQAANNGNAQELQRLVQISQQQGQEAHQNNMVELLHAAARNNHTACIAVLLNAGANINSSRTRCGYSRSPLFAAVESYLIFVIVGPETVASVPRIGKGNVCFGEPLDYPVRPWAFDYDQGGRTDTMESIRLLLAARPDLSIRNASLVHQEGISALELALLCSTQYELNAQKRQQIDALINLLIQHDAFPLSEWSWRILGERTVRRGNDRSLARLLQIARQHNLQPGWMNTILSLAARLNHTECIRLLLEAGAIINNREDEYMRTPLYAAVESQLMFIVGRNNLARVRAFDYINSSDGGATDTTQSIQQLLNADANPSLAMHAQGAIDYIVTRDGTSPLGLAMEVRDCFAQNAPERQQINAVIDLLQAHHANLSFKDCAVICYSHDPLVRTLTKQMNAYIDGRERHAEPLFRTSQWIARGLTASVLAISSFCGYRFSKVFMSNRKSLALVGVGCLAALVPSWISIPYATRCTFALANKVRKKWLEHSLLRTTDQIHATNPDQQTLRALQFIVSGPRIVMWRDPEENDIGAQCANRLGIQLIDCRTQHIAG